MPVEKYPHLKTIVWGAVSIIAAAIVIWLLLAYYPAHYRYFPQCPFYELTHLYCPGCGGTRALFYLLHGNIVGVFRNNAMFIPTLCFVGFLIWRRRHVLYPPILWGYIILLVAFWILRNIPYYPFNLLAPAPFAS